VVRAVDGLDLAVEEGEILGCIGPNGAGKSTTIKMLTGILLPSSGRVRVAGVDPQRERTAIARRIGVVFGQRTQLWWDLPLRDSFELLRWVYRVPEDRYRSNLERFTALLDLGPFLDTPVRQLSLGQRMRGDLVASLLHDPGILFLDEPTIGLDVVSKARVRDFLRHINAERSVTMILTTHDLSDIERLCQRVVILDAGRILHDDTVEGITDLFGGARTVVVDLEEEREPLALALEGVVVTRVEGPRQWVSFPRSGPSAAEVIAAVAGAARVRDLTVVEPAIEDVVARLYRP
jgi:ABC-2 type transport system ATP-binding protein